ncbi:MAG: class I SAM-dependent methyltransferase [Spartobacteria bacterium]|nr:class I SAM-dependent methyltransferase [Spartobacteria bacterium]
MKTDFFEQMIWKDDRMLYGDLVFRLQHCRNDAWELGDACFIFHKTKFLMDQYAQFWKTYGPFSAERVFELGIWDGGSVALWYEFLSPKRHVAIDITDKQNSPYLQQFITDRKARDRIHVHWNTDQRDRRQLTQLIAREMDGPLDLVIDDASHMYDLTRESFNILFPRLRAGGLYIIEDWAWGHWTDFQRADHPWAGKTPLTRLVFELVEAAGSSPSAINRVFIHQGFVVVEKGADRQDPDAFRLEHLISRGSTDAYH